MADGSSDGVESATLEGPAAAWVAERAAEQDLSTDEFLTRVVAAYRAAQAGADAADPVGDVVTETDLESELASLRADLEGDVADVDEEFAAKLEDVRERVIQVKREADAKAPADHDHPELDERVADALAAAEDAQAEVGAVAGRLGRLSERLDAGFENFEEVLTYLRDETDDLDGKVTALATAVLAMRESVGAVAAANARRERTERLKQRANRENVRVADCEACGSETTVSLLTAPECPACGAAFEDVDANEGWFGSHTLLTGSAPALTSGDQPEAGEVEDWLGADADTLEAMVDGEDGNHAAGGETAVATDEDAMDAASPSNDGAEDAFEDEAFVEDAFDDENLGAGGLDGQPFDDEAFDDDLAAEVLDGDALDDAAPDEPPTRDAAPAEDAGGGSGTRERTDAADADGERDG
ncbi:hypothetical protein [Halobacterium yunchengense]|uniref:hypothetical protein n=1 Tax=Halobacterium yunchengense TaxID=3108497 RepID=UPI00300929FE